MSEAFDPSREELYSIIDEESADGAAAGDVYRQGSFADPSGSGLMGQASQMRLKEMALGHPLIRYKDLVLEADVYKDPEGGGLMVNIFCPRCRNSLRITSQRKQIEFTAALVRDRATGRMLKRGTLSVSPFQCTWELGRGTDQTGADRMDFGMGLCRWTVAIDNNVAKDA